MNLASALRLYLITDRRFSSLPLIEQVRRAVAGGVTMVQLREKDASAREILALGEELHAFLAPRGIPLIVDDRLDLALALNADGVHLGRNDLPIATARRLLGPNKILGATAGTPEEACARVAEGADYLGIGAMHATATKSDHSPVIGFSGLTDIARACPAPLVAIGGITAADADQATAAGAAGVAVVSALLTAPDIEAAARELRTHVEAGFTMRRRRWRVPPP